MPGEDRLRGRTASHWSMACQITVRAVRENGRIAELRRLWHTRALVLTYSAEHVLSALIIEIISDAAAQSLISLNMLLLL